MKIWLPRAHVFCRLVYNKFISLLTEGVIGIK
jgi:hypothetical protein